MAQAFSISRTLVSGEVYKMVYRLAAFIVCLSLVALSDSHLAKLAYEVDPDWPQLPVGRNFAETAGVAVDAKENVYVFHRGAEPIFVIDKSGKFLRSMGKGIYKSPHGIHIDKDGNVWTADDAGHVVAKMDSSGRVRMVLGRLGEAGEKNDRFNRPTDIATAANGDFYVTDGYGNSRVVKFSKEGKFLKAWGKKGVGKGEFNTPHTVTVDKEGLVYVGDRENFRIQVFDADGNFLRMWDHVGSPWGLDITEDQKLFMTDGHNNRVIKLDLDGGILGVLGEFGKLPGQFNFCHHIAAGASGAIYTSEILNWRAQKFVPR